MSYKVLQIAVCAMLATEATAADAGRPPTPPLVEVIHIASPLDEVPPGPLRALVYSQHYKSYFQLAIMIDLLPPPGEGHYSKDTATAEYWLNPYKFHLGVGDELATIVGSFKVKTKPWCVKKSGRCSFSMQRKEQYNLRNSQLVGHESCVSRCHKQCPNAGTTAACVIACPFAGCCKGCGS